jgi:hypothetical protein
MYSLNLGGRLISILPVEMIKLIIMQFKGSIYLAGWDKSKL